MGVALWDGGVIPKLDYHDTGARQNIGSPLLTNFYMLGTYAIDSRRLPQNAKGEELSVDSFIPSVRLTCWLIQVLDGLPPHLPWAPLDEDSNDVPVYINMSITSR